MPAYRTRAPLRKQMMHELCYFSDDPYPQDTVSRREGNIQIQKIPFYCIFGMKCILAVLTTHIFTLNCFLIVQGDHICDLDLGVGKNGGTDLFY